jgi:hypothetical protein
MNIDFITFIPMYWNVMHTMLMYFQIGETIDNVKIGDQLWLYFMG